MKIEYIVTDALGNVSWSVDPESPEKFKTFAAARKRAEELAHGEPGETIRIYELTAEACCDVLPVETRRAHPSEHYPGGTGRKPKGKRDAR